MKSIKSNFNKIFLLLIIALTIISCDKDNFQELQTNPNVPGRTQAIPPAQLLSTSLYEIAKGGGVMENEPGNLNEEPLRGIHKWAQYHVSVENFYGGRNFYDWSNSSTMYSVLRNVIEMEHWSNPNDVEELRINPYIAMGKFLRAYSFIWFSQRVGDIPVTEAGLGLENLTPKYNTQKDVYMQSLGLLEEANEIFNQLLSQASPASLAGDFYLDGNIAKWQKVVNAYTLRILISLSQRADDTPELNVKERFAAIVNNPVKYPLMTGNVDNIEFSYNSSTNRFTKANLSGNYNSSTVIAKTYIDLMTKNMDPRVFVTTSPALAQIASGLAPDDFDAYVGADNSLSLSELNDGGAAGLYSHSNHRRYYNQNVVYDNAEPTILFGYAEMCLNIAEGINRGWAVGNAGEWYQNGVEASLAFYNIMDGNEIDIEDVDGNYLGTTTFNLTQFFESIEYQGNNSDGLTQILEQKFINFHLNSGWEPFYQWRRTGIPKFIDSGIGLGATQKIPRRWQYPPAEISENSENVQAAIQRQFGGTDDLYQDIWLIKE